jgi:hypothetical protein
VAEDPEADSKIQSFTSWEKRMTEPHKIWIEQCDAARGIREAYGTERALGYLIGEKLIDFVRAADREREFARETPSFIAEIKRIFEPWELRRYVEGVRRVGALAHTSTEEEYETLQAAGAIEQDPAAWADDILILERIKKLLLD